LVLNELISNTIKYAFPIQDDCRILITLYSIDNTYELIYKDNGIGYDENQIVNAIRSTLGFELIHSLMDQIDGSINKEKSKTGVKFKLLFPTLNEA
jgi:two-component sensor histidine kinase